MKTNRTNLKMVICAGVLWVALTAVAMAMAMAVVPQVTRSKDGTPITFEVHGSGEPTLVLIHCWSGDMRYWREQTPVLSKTNRVITLDLAGHGHSGMNRKDYTMAAFGEDVQAVVEAVGAEKIILIGHSMGGVVMAEAAKLMPERVIGLIGVDTLGNIEMAPSAEDCANMTAPLAENFQNGLQSFVGSMIVEKTAPELREWILADMGSAPFDVAWSSIQNFLAQFSTGEITRTFEQIRAPVILVNSDLSPIGYEENRRHIARFDAIVIEGSDHFLNLARPEECNAALADAILKVQE